MQTVSQQYYAAVAETAAQLDKAAPDYKGILERLEAKRVNIVILRNGIRGEASAFIEKFDPPYGESTLVPKDEFGRLASLFALSISYYFRDSEDTFHFQGTVATGLLIELRTLSKTPRNSSALRDARSKAREAMEVLENRWEFVSKAYADLKLYCGA